MGALPEPSSPPHDGSSPEATTLSSHVQLRAPALADVEGARAGVDAGDGSAPAGASPEVLAREEAARTRGFARAVTILCGMGLVAQAMLGGTTWLRVLFIASLLATGIASAWMWRVAGDPLRTTDRRARVFAAVCAVTAVIAPYYLGVFSPAPVFIMLGIGFFALGEDPLTAIGLPVASAVGYAGVAAGILLGVLPDAGVMRATELAPSASAPLVVTVPLVYLLALWQARLGRRATVQAIERGGLAVRDMVQREKQLEEANRDLDRLLHVGAQDVGVYTGVKCGAYVLDRLVGRGAMGEVYAATEARSGNTAAVKLLQPGLAGDANLVLRFLREGEAASKLRAPNVVTIHEVGKTADGAPFIAMELLRGHDLGWHLRHRTRMSLDEAVFIADQVALGLEAARVAGIVHRDLKPQNVFLAQQPRSAPVWKILDFGVSRFAGTNGTLTQDQIVGTPGYMSPEQAAGREATHKSDVFSFGAMLYRALTGQPPFTGTDTPQILYQVVYRNAIRPSALARNIPPDVDLVLAIALAKDKDDRFASALEMAAAFRAAAKSELDAGLRLHARTVLAALPWGRSAKDSGVHGATPPVA